MRGLQLDDASMQKLELDMREEVTSSLCFFFCVCGGVLCSSFAVKVRKSVSSLNWKCLKMCAQMHKGSHDDSTLFFFPPALLSLSEIRELSVRGRPERGWSRRDHAVHDARGRARRQVMIMMRFISRLSLSSFPFEFVALIFPVVESVGLSLSLSLFAMYKKGRRRKRRRRREQTERAQRRRRFSKSACATTTRRVLPEPISDV